MRIAVLTDRIPQTPNQPGCPRLYSICREWQKQGHQIFLMVVGKQQLPEFELPVFEKIRFLAPPPIPKLIGRLNHKLRAAPFFAQIYRNRRHTIEIRQQVEALLAADRTDHLVVFGINSTDFLPESASSDRTCIDLIDALPLLYLREAKLEPNLSRRKQLEIEAESIGKWAKQLQLRDFKLSVVGAEDRNFLQKHLGIEADVIPNGVDLDYFNYRDRRPVKNRIIFTGVMNYQPNIDTAVYLVEEIFPKVREKFAEAEVYLVGANPPTRVTDLGNLSGVKVTDTVPDIRPYLAEASLFACPMRSGTGIKNKILTAMAMKIPIVSTSLGIAGVDAIDGEHCLIAEDPYNFAEQVSNILTGSLNTESLVESGYRLVQENYSWAQAAEQLLAKILKRG